MIQSLIKPFAVDDDLEDYIVLKPSKRARRIALRLDTKARKFNLVVPPGISKKYALRFAQDHKEWMRGQLAELAEPIRLEHGVSIPVFGQAHLIDVHYDERRKNTSVSIEDGRIIVVTNKDDPSPRITRHLKKIVKDELRLLSEEKAKQIKKNVTNVSVRDTKSRWGSCSADGSISYSWRLIFAPYEALDYVVAHEVAHLQHHDHSDKFWALCRELSENYMDGHYWMRNHGKELMRYC